MSEMTDNTFFPANIPGERTVNDLSDYKREKFAGKPFTRELMITAAGYHPNAMGHYCRRPRGSRGFVFLYCIDGSGWVKYEGEDILVTRNQGVFLKPARAHEYGASKTHPWSYYYIHYEGDLSAHYTRLILDGQESGTYWIQETDEYLKCFSLILSNLEDGWDYPNMVMGSAHLHKLFAYLFWKKQRKGEGVRNVSAKNRVQAIADMIEENPQNAASGLEFARAANLSNSRFRELFKALLGMPPKQYSLHMQIEKSKKLLISADLCIYEISERVGIADSHYFSRIFSKKVGMSPTEYRERYKKSENG